MTDRSLSEDQLAREAASNGDWPAHPTQALDATGMPRSEHCPGLTKRELFAAMAMQGIRMSDFAAPSSEVAQQAIEDADALLKELAK